MKRSENAVIGVKLLRLIFEVLLVLSYAPRCANAVALPQDESNDTSLAQSPQRARASLLNDLQSGQLDEAIELGRQSVARWPNDADIRHLLGLVFFKTRRHSLAIAELQKAEALDESNPDTPFDLALVYLDESQYLPAASELERSIKLRPANPLARVLLGRAYQNTNRTLQAIEEFQQALKMNHSVQLGHYDLGFAYASLGRNQEAIAEYEKEIAHNPENATVLYQLGHLLLQAGSFTSAIKYLRQATEAEIDPPNADAFYDLGKALSLAGDPESAVAPLERSAVLSPSDPRPHYQLARDFEKLGKHEDAQREWQSFAELKKAYPQTGGMASGQPQ